MTQPMILISDIDFNESGNNCAPPCPIFAKSNPPTEISMAINRPQDRKTLDFLLSCIVFLRTGFILDSPRFLAVGLTGWREGADCVPPH